MLTAGANSYAYDANGNQLSAGTRTFTYDLANRLTTTIEGPTTTTYAYDGDGNRLQASTGAAASDKTNYTWDVNGGLPQLVTETEATMPCDAATSTGNGRSPCPSGRTPSTTTTTRSAPSATSPQRPVPRSSPTTTSPMARFGPKRERH